MCNWLGLSCCIEAPVMKNHSGVEWRNNLENTHEVSRFLLRWLMTRGGSVGKTSLSRVIGSFSDIICLDGARTGHSGWFSPFFPSIFIFSHHIFLLRETPMDPLFVIAILGVSLLLLCNSDKTMKNIPAKPEMVESLFFHLESQSVMPEITGLAAGGSCLKLRDRKIGTLSVAFRK